MSWTVADLPDQTGRSAVVTGANSGLGLEIATVLAGKGAHVVLACRSEDKAARAVATIREVHPRASVATDRLDLADLAGVTAFARRLRNSSDRLDLLVNNAGLMATDQQRTADGFELQFGVNHLGGFVLTAHLLPLLEATPGSRVAAMSSMGHRAGRMHFDDLMGERAYRRWRAYFQSKLANLLFIAELSRQLVARGSGTLAVAAHPGGTRTDLGSEGAGISNRVSSALTRTVAQPVQIGALPMLRALTDPTVTAGQYYGPRFQTMGVPVLETPSARARNADDAVRLWRASTDLTRAHLPDAVV